MKRDMEIVRLILQSIESGEEPAATEGVPVDEHVYHIDLMIEAGLLKGDMVGRKDGSPRGAAIQRLTWAGHDFLDAARDPTIWQKAKEKVLKPGASWTFGLLVEWLRNEIKLRLNI